MKLIKMGSVESPSKSRRMMKSDRVTQQTSRRRYIVSSTNRRHEYVILSTIRPGGRPGGRAALILLVVTRRQRRRRILCSDPASMRVMTRRQLYIINICPPRDADAANISHRCRPRQTTTTTHEPRTKSTPSFYRGNFRPDVQVGLGVMYSGLSGTWVAS